jgi:hypothetical protein
VARTRGDDSCCMRLSDLEILVWCTILILLEIQHLKWIVWENWTCRRCGVKHRECGHLSRIMVWL